MVTFLLALEPVRKQYQSDPRNPSSAQFIALILAHIEEINEAVSIIEKSAAENPDNAISKFGLLLKYGLQKDGERAYGAITDARL